MKKPFLARLVRIEKSACHDPKSGLGIQSTDGKGRVIEKCLKIQE